MSKELYCGKCEEDVVCQEEEVLINHDTSSTGYFCPLCGKELTDQAFAPDVDGDREREIEAENNFEDQCLADAILSDELTNKQEDLILAREDE